MGVPAVASLTPMTGVTSVGTGATMPMTATALAREEAVVAGEGIQFVLRLIDALSITCFSDANNFSILYHQRSSRG